MFMHRAGKKQQHRQSCRFNPVTSITKQPKLFTVLLMSLGGSLLQILQPRGSDANRLKLLKVLVIRMLKGDSPLHSLTGLQ